MIKKITIVISLLALIFFIKVKLSHSLDCEPGFQYSNNDELKQIIAICEQKTNSLREKASTLTSQIQYMNTQIYLAGLKISETEDKIKTTTEEITTLNNRIDGLDNSLNYLSKLLLNKIVEGYKKRSVSLFTVLLDSDTGFDLFNKIKYLKTAQENNQKLLIQVQEIKINFEEQKKLREERKKQLDALQSTLNSQKADLDIQQQAKQNLLAATRSSESVYQNLLEKARAELSGFSAFTQSAGGGLTSFGNGSNGWYFTQRDPAWGNLTIGNSPYPVWQAGCALTSVAMVCKKYGQSITPGSMAQDYGKFIYGDLLNDYFSCDGKSTNWITVSKNNIKDYVKRGVPVILRLIAPSVSGLHFIVGWGWNDGADDMIIHDPYYGPDLNFTSHYDWSQITTAIAIE